MLRRFAFLALMAVSLPTLAQPVPAIEWYTLFGGVDDDFAGGICQSSTGGWVVAGGTLSADGLAATNHGFTDALLIELNTTGALQWHHLYGGTGWEGAADLLQYTEGGYVVLGTTNSTDGDVSGPGQGLDDIWVFRVNDAGSILWQRKLGTHLVDAASSIAETSDGGILFTAHIGSLVEDGDVAPGMGIGGFWLVKLNADGDILWQNRFGGSGWDAPYGMVQTLDGGWILVGVTTSTDGDVSFH